MILGYLDKIRLKSNKDNYIASFRSVLEKNKEYAIKSVNEIKTFPTFYLILPEIKNLNLNTEKTYIKLLINDILSKKNVENNNNFSETLKWIVNTGYNEDGLSDEYDEIIDISVSILINTFSEKSILPIVCEMIFNRNKKGNLIHDLLWAYFKINDPYTLRLIAKHLNSDNLEDVKLACKLLDITPSVDINNKQDLKKKRGSYLSWLTENDPFLYFTGESFQYSSTPSLCQINYDRKYICRGTPSYEVETYIPADDDEYKCLEAFSTLKPEDKKKLSEYSFKLFNKNPTLWKKWINSPISEQINMGVQL